MHRLAGRELSKVLSNLYALQAPHQLYATGKSVFVWLAKYKNTPSLGIWFDMNFNGLVHG